MLAGVSLTWYTWLEQGRRINASNDVLLAIGRALRLDDAGLEHLLSLTEPGTATIAAPAEAPSAVVRLLDALMPAPAYVLGPIWEFVGWNTAQARLYPRIIELEAPRRNLMWVLFADPSTRELIVDWDIHARQALAEFRSATSSVRHDPAMVELVDLFVRRELRVRRLVARARRVGLRDPAAALPSSGRRRADLRVSAAHAGRVAVAASRRPTPRPRRRLRRTPRRPPLPRLNATRGLTRLAPRVAFVRRRVRHELQSGRGAEREEIA